MVTGPAQEFFFSCLHCKVPYRAWQEPSTEQVSGIIPCEECPGPAYEWTGFYKLRDWRVVKSQRSRQ
jgi:hypothetical protein